MTLQTLIVDDEPLAREGIRILLQRDPEITVVGECGDGTTAVNFLKSTPVDLLFLDIQMPSMNGFDVLAHLDQSRIPAVIFVTAYDRFALQAFKVHALDYLLKPYSDEEFYTAVNRAKEYIRLKSFEPLTEKIHHLLSDLAVNPPVATPVKEYLSRIAVNLKGSIIPVPVTEIEWIEAADYYAVLHTREKSYVLRETLQALEEQLDPLVFLRIHRSAIVRIDQIQEIRPYFEGESVLLLKNGSKHKVGKTYKQKLKRVLKVKG